MLKLLHLVPASGPGGPMRSLLVLTRLARLSHPSIRHTAISLQPGEYIPLTFELRRQGATVLRAPAIDAINAEIGQADVVLLHFWSTPRLWRLLVSDLPDARYMLWLKVLGKHAPQLLNADLLAGVQAWAFTAPPPANLVERMGQVPVIPGFVDRQRVADLPSRGELELVRAVQGCQLGEAGAALLAAVCTGRAEEGATRLIPALRHRPAASLPPA